MRSDSGGARAPSGVAGGVAAPSADLVLLDGELVPREEATISAFDRGVLYGESLFETVKVVDGAPCLWERHRDRLAAGCRELGIPLDIGTLEAGVRRLLRHGPLGHGVLRVQVTGGVQPGGGRGLTAPSEGRHPRVVASCVESRPLGSDVYASGVRVVSGEGLLRPSPSLKSGNYLASVRAKALAESTGAFECVLVDGRPPRVLEGSFSTVLLWDGKTLVCPPEDGRLPGVTAGVVLEEAVRAGLQTETRPIELAEFSGSDRVGAGGEASTAAGLLLTGSLLGVCPCSSLDGTPLRPTAEMAARLRERLNDREDETRRAWGGG